MTRNLTLGAALLLLGLFVALPLGLLTLRLFADPGGALTALTDPLSLSAALNTVVLTVGVLAVTLGLGVPLGWLVGRTDLPRADLLKALCTTPWVVPPYITTIAWITLFNPTNGWFNQPLASLGLPVLDVYGLGGMIWAMGLAYTPLVMLATAEALSRMDASLEEQARIAGASPLQTLTRVTLPMALPGITAGMSFVVAASAAAFGVPYLLASGTSQPAFVLTTRIYNALDLEPATGRPIALGLSALLLLLGIGLPWLVRRAVASRRFTTVTGKATRAAPFALGRARPFALAFVLLYGFVAVGIPLLTIGLTSLMGNFGRGLSPDNLGLGNYVTVLFERSDTLGALSHSLVLAAGAASAATLLGALLAWMEARTDMPGRKAVTSLARLPYAVPGTVLALGLILAWSQEVRVIVMERLTFGLMLADTLWILGLAYLVKFLAFPVGQAQAGLAAIHPSLEESARMSGAGWGETLTRITLPLLRRDLVAAWVLVFMPAFSEVTMSILLAGPDSRVVGTLLFELQTYGDPPAAAVLAVVVTVGVLLANGMLRFITGGRAGL